MTFQRRAEMWPGTPQWDRLSKRHQMAYRWLWWQEGTSAPWHMGRRVGDHWEHETIQPEPINFSTQLGFYGS